jgi:membrane protein
LILINKQVPFGGLLHSRYRLSRISAVRGNNYFKLVKLGDIKRAFVRAYEDVVRHHTLQVSAALSYYCVLSALPALIFLSAVMRYIPLPDLFGRVLLMMGALLPADTMRGVYSILADVLSAHRVTWLSFGMLGTIWMASASFDAIIEALDIAYDVEDPRPFWKTRLLAVGLAAITGSLLLAALAVTIVGPRFGDWLAARLALSTVFAMIWPTLRWSIAITFTVLAVELIYFLAPYVKQRFTATLPGALLSVGAWLGLSHLLGIYFRHFANYNRTYGVLGGMIAFMIWLYWTSFALLVGAELNAELAKASKKGSLPPKAIDAAKREDEISTVHDRAA